MRIYNAKNLAWDGTGLRLGSGRVLAGVELARANRYMRSLSLLMIDIDHFKDVNDRLGHAAGDGVLQNVASICRSAAHGRQHRN
jgi:diguanylate cyclase (GGDEF)-like protein